MLKMHPKAEIFPKYSLSNSFSFRAQFPLKHFISKAVGDLLQFTRMLRRQNAYQHMVSFNLQLTRGSAAEKWSRKRVLQLLPPSVV